MTALNWGVALPQSSAGDIDFVDKTERFVRSAESYGLHSLWAQEQLLGSDPSLEPVVNLAYVAALTTEIKLGTAAVIAPVRNPVVLAKQLSSLDRLSRGRLIVGLAIGDMPSLYRASGVPVDGRGLRLDEVLRVLKGLWTEESFDYDSPTHALRYASMEPKPSQRPHPPLWFGGRSVGALKRAVREGQGWVSAGGTSIARFGELSRDARALAGAEGREFSVAKKVYVAVEDNRKIAHSRLVEWFASHWGDGQDPVALADSVGVCGTAEDCAEAISEIAALDPDLIILNPVYGEHEQLARLAESVLPLLGG